MRLIHTADWHLGNAMHDVDRKEEQKAFLDWLIDEIDRQNADTLVISGDIYDVKNPPAWAEQLYFTFMSRLPDTACKNVVVIGGNHDSGKRLDSTNAVLERLNVHVVGWISDRDIEDLVFGLKDEHDTVYAVCIAVPEMKEGELRRYYDGDWTEKTFSDRAFGALYKACLEQAETIKGDKNIPVIAMGHLYAAGLEGRYAGAEDEVKTDDGVQVLDVVGNLGKVHADIFPEGIDYVALGHIHYSTRVGGENRIRYSGSPFVMGFDDADIVHYIHAVDIDPGRGNTVEAKRIEVPKTAEYRRLKGSKEEILFALEGLINGCEDKADAKNKIPVYIELMYKAGEGSQLLTMVDDLKFPDNIKVVSRKAVRPKDVDGYREFGEHYDLRSMKSLDPEDIVRQLILAKRPLSEEEKAGKTDDEVKEMEEKLVGRYLPIFMQAFNDVEAGADDEDS